MYEAFQSFRELRKLWLRGELKYQPKPPQYRIIGGLAPITYPKQALKLVGNQIRFPLGKTVKCWFDLGIFSLEMPSNLEFSRIREIRIIPRNGCFYAEFVYQLEEVANELDRSQALGIDPGLGNWLTCVTTEGKSFIIDGKRVKSWNQGYNKFQSTYKEKKPPDFWSNKLSRKLEKRNRRIRDAINKAAKFVINYCITHQIGNIVFGWNKGIKDSITLGKVNNQKFVQIPTARLKTRIQQLCELNGLNFLDTEESYTSVTSFLDNDFLPKFGEKPESWKPSGRRIKRGLYRTRKKWLINADAQGAVNVLRKVATNLGLDLGRVGRRCLTCVTRINLYPVSKRIPCL